MNSLRQIHSLGYGDFIVSGMHLKLLKTRRFVTTFCFATGN